MSFKTLSLSALSVCKHCRLHFSSTGLASGRFLNEKTTQRRTVRSVARLDSDVERELQRIQRAKLEKERSNVIESYYKRSSVMNKNFKIDLAKVLGGVPELIGLGMVLTKTKVNVDFTNLQVFWSSKSREKEGEISQLLTQKEAAIIAAARSRFGEMPNLEFLPDTSYISTSSVDSLFSKISVEMEHEGESVAGKVMDLQLESEPGSLDRSSLLEVVEKSQVRSQAAHRYNPEQDLNFQNNYVQSIEANGAARKKEINLRIKKFLNERHRQLQKTER